MVDSALQHFNDERYQLDEYVIASNHIHATITPFGAHTLSSILHSWKNYTAHQIANLTNQSGSSSGSGVPPLKTQSRAGSATRSKSKIWQKESFDHIIRSSESLERFRTYIRAHV